MERNGNIVRYTAKELRDMVARGEDRTDWARVESMSQEEVERLADEDDGPLPEGWEKTAIIGLPPRKAAVHIRLDSDILTWFRGQGRGYQTRINAALRAFVNASHATKPDRP